MTTDDQPSPRGPAERAARLRRFATLSHLDDSQIAALAEVASEQAFVAGDVVYSEHSEGGDFLLVDRGEVEARRTTPLGEQRVATLVPGDLVGEISLIDGRPRSSSVVATASGVLLRFTSRAVAGLVTVDPHIEVALLRVFCRSLAHKVRQANMVMSQIMVGDLSEQRAVTTSQGERQSFDDATKRHLLREQGRWNEDLQNLSQVLAAERFVAGDTIFAEGERGDTLYVVAEGAVRISRHMAGLGEEALVILGRGEVFGEMAWIDSSPRSADAIAHTGGCTVLAISRQQLDGTLDQKVATHAHFLKLICQVLCRRVRHMNDQLVAYRTIAFF